MNTMRKFREWTPEQREEQGRKLSERKIWLASTGPRTPEGKAISSQNGLKHGGRSRHMSAFHAVLKKFAEWGKAYSFLNNRKNNFFVTSELIDQMKSESEKMIQELHLTYELMCENGVRIDELGKRREYYCLLNK